MISLAQFVVLILGVDEVVDVRVSHDHDIIGERWPVPVM